MGSGNIGPAVARPAEPVPTPLLKCTVQLTSRLTIACEDTYVLFYFCRVTQSDLTCDTRVNFPVEHASYILCGA